MRNSNSLRKYQEEDRKFILRRFRSQSTITEGKRQDPKLTKMLPPPLDTTENVRLMQFVSRNLFIYSLSCLPWKTFIHKNNQKEISSIIYYIMFTPCQYIDLTWIHTVHPYLKCNLSILRTQNHFHYTRIHLGSHN